LPNKHLDYQVSNPWRLQVPLERGLFLLPNRQLKTKRKLRRSRPLRAKLRLLSSQP